MCPPPPRTKAVLRAVGLVFEEGIGVGMIFRGAMSDLGFVHRYEHGLAETTLFLLHGTGGDESDLIPLGRELAPDANLLSPRGKVLESGMPRFFKRLAMGRFDLEDLALRTDELAVFI